MSGLEAVLLPLANHAPDGLGLALLLYFGPVVALVAFLIFLSRRGRGDDEPTDERDAGHDASGEELQGEEERSPLSSGPSSGP